ncbi:TIM-barrel domain-containing protein [Sphingomonas sp. EC-HK361]|uniref:TIM-barrel domain-containing protein n=1 Tax=Sphingomonas sp. EC-HK361 TaxID=2038397 RepID=UPI001F2181AA|nr:TIM-barrel domain-containing protein [Sphingomonas sp. EC-HK361]
MPALTRRTLLAGASPLVAAALLPGWAQGAQGIPVDRIERLHDGVLIHRGPAVTRVRIAAAGVASVIHCPAAKLASAGGFFAHDGLPVRFAETGPVLAMIGQGIRVAIDRGTGCLAFHTPDGGRVIAEAPTPLPLAGVATTRRQGFTIGATERLHGLGQFREPVFDYRGQSVFLAQANSDAVNPFLVSTAGWGLLWDTGTAAHFRSHGRAIDYHSVAGDTIRYHVCLGVDMDAVIRGYRALTGAAALLPKWAYGYWQSKESYARQVDLVAVVDEYRRRGLPLDAIVLDYKYWGGNENFSGMKFDAATFPDPKAMVDHVHAADVHLLASIWPAFGTATDLYRAMGAKGYLLPGEHWSGGKVFDVSNADARALYWRSIKRGLIDIGVDGLWTDGNEPELRSTGERYGTAASFAANGWMAAGPIAENLLTYSWYQARGLSDAMRRDIPAKRPVILSRSAYAGQQAFGAVTWSGDIFASWGTLANQIVAALNFSMAGIPWWTCDIGAFLVFHRYPEGLADPAYKELYVRWFQFGAFLPVFRAHGTHIPRELWQFGEPGDPHYDALEAALRQRYRLMPYIYSVAAAAVYDGDTPMRALAMDFPDDPRARAEQAAFLFGRDLLVRIVDRPFEHASRNMQEFIPSRCVQGAAAPAARIEYYEGAQFERRVSSRLTDDIKMSWSGDLPAALAGKPYSLRWTGRIVAEETGPHRFSVIGKGAIRLVFDHRVVVDGASGAAKADGATGGVSFRGHEGDAFFDFTADLVVGRAYDFLLEQRQPTPDAVSLWFEWITPSIRRRQQLPARHALPVVLPKGRDWYDLHSGRRHRGGTAPMIDITLQSHPLFARAGAIVPMVQGLDRTATPPGEIEIHVYAGADGHFVLYDDAGNGQGHLNGEATRIAFYWNDRAATLSIGARQGAFSGMPPSLKMKLVFHDGANHASIRPLVYEGAAQVIPLRQSMRAEEPGG